MILKSPFGMSPTGVGPLVYLCAVPFLIVGYLFPSDLPNIFILFALLQLVGIILIITGIAVFSSTMLLLLDKFNNGELATTGAFKYSRNPLYSCWIVLILPGMALLFLNGWIILSSLSMYIGLNLLIKKEEDMLEKAFGQEYLDYKKTVGRVFLKL